MSKLEAFGLWPALLALAAGVATFALVQAPAEPQQAEGDRPPARGGLPPNAPPQFGGAPPFGGPPPFSPDDGDFAPPGGPFPGGPDGPGPGRSGPMMGQKTKLVELFDKDGDHRLNAQERKAARESLAQRPSGRRGPRGPGGPGFPGRNQAQEPPLPGPKLSPADVKHYPDAPFYDPFTLRTLFLEFDDADWEKELAAFYHTDVEVPAMLIVDGKEYPDVGVRFRGNTSYMMVEEGRKRSLALSLDFAHPDQQLYGYRTITLLNSHEDPSFLHTVLYMHLARHYFPAPKANFVRVVINGESWGVYVNVQSFNKDFIRDWFGTTKGARWKVSFKPNNRAGLAYLGDEAAPYKRIYEIKSKDDPKSWGELIRLCKVLNETSPDQLEAALTPLLDIDSTLKFLALDNVLINNDGFWIRASDFNLYRDPQGRFHLIPYDVNESFGLPGGPGFGGPPGGPGFGGGPLGGFGPGQVLAEQILSQADKNEDGKLTAEELTSLAGAWFDKLDPNHTGKLAQDQFMAELERLLPPPPGVGMRGDGPDASLQPPTRGPVGGRGAPGGLGPARFLGPSLFAAFDANKDGSVTRAELQDAFAKWLAEGDPDKSGSLNKERLAKVLNTALPPPDFRSRGGRMGGLADLAPRQRGGFGPGGFDGGRFPGGPGFGGGPRVEGVQLDPLIAANDQGKPLLAKLLAVPSLRARYLAYVHEIAAEWLDWDKLGPLARRYHDLIAADVKADTRKLYSYEAFEQSLTGDGSMNGVREPRPGMSLKRFADERRAYLLKVTAPKVVGSGN